MNDKIAKYYIPKIEDKILQGDIFKNISYTYSIKDNDKTIELIEFNFPKIIVLSQSCDTDYLCDLFNNNGKITKFMMSILVAPVYEFNSYKSGEYFEDIYNKVKRKDQNRIDNVEIVNLDMDRRAFNSDEASIIKNGVHYRYHILELTDKSLLPKSIIDFKHYFTLNTNYLIENRDKRICRIEDLFAEQVTLKFSNFLSRVGIPDN